MRAEKLKEKALKYLRSGGIKFEKDSIKYLGIMKDAELPDGSGKDMHVIRYHAWFEGQYRLCYINADAETDLLELHITPYYFETIVDKE